MQNGTFIGCITTPVHVTFHLGLSLLNPMCGTTMYTETGLLPVSYAFVYLTTFSVMVEVKGAHGNVGNKICDNTVSTGVIVQ